MNNTVVFIGAFPPPIGGAAKNNAIVLEELRKYAPVEVLDTTVPYSAHDRGGRKVYWHTTKLLGNLLKAFRWKATTIDTIYISLPGGATLAASFLYILVAKLKGLRCVLHHRSFNYIYKHSIVIAAIERILGRGDRHVFLCEEMRRRYRHLYKSTTSCVMLSNAVFSGPFRQRDVEKYRSMLGIQRKNKPLRLGHLSNLCEEKGLNEVVGVFKRLVTKKIAVVLHIGGEPIDEQSRLTLRSIKDAYPNAVFLHGKINTDRKTAFYEAIDIFLFPTRFRQEAQPNVLYEAMRQGCFCITVKRGCIPEMLSNRAGLIIHAVEDFVDEAAKVIRELASDRVRLVSYQRDSLEDFAHQYNRAEREFSELIKSIVKKKTGESHLSN